MTSHVTVVLADGERIEFEVSDQELVGFDHRAAHHWLGREYEAAVQAIERPVITIDLANNSLGY